MAVWFSIVTRLHRSGRCTICGVSDPTVAPAVATATVLQRDEGVVNDSSAAGVAKAGGQADRDARGDAEDDGSGAGYGGGGPSSPSRRLRQPEQQHVPKAPDCVTVDGVREHQAQFQKIADNNDDPFYPGSRAAGTEGYADSVEYVVGLLKDAGYDVTLDPVEFQFEFPALLQQLTPVQATHRPGDCR
jgi:hypothetical protein